MKKQVNRLTLTTSIIESFDKVNFYNNIYDKSKMFKYCRIITWAVVALIIFFQLKLSYVLAENNDLNKNSVFVVFHTSDIHGRLESQTKDNKTYGGFAILANALRSEKLKAYRYKVLPLYFDCGDFFQGTPVVDYYKGECMATLFNHLKTFSVTIGNHDFDYSYQQLQKVIKDFKFPVVLCNVYDKVTKRLIPNVREYIIVEWRGYKLGITGAITPDTPYISLKSNITNLEFLDPIPILRKITNTLTEKGANFIILLSHCGIEFDRKIANEIDNIDLILGGHTHALTLSCEWQGKKPTAIIHPSSEARCFSRTIISEQNGKLVIATSATILLDKSVYGENQETKKIIDRLLEPVNAMQKEVIGISKVQLLSGFSGGNSPAGAYIADAMREYSGADFAFANLGGVRSDINQGPLTYEMIYNLQPFANTVVVMELSGKQIVQLIEEVLSDNWYPISSETAKVTKLETQYEGLKREFQGKYGYLIPSGLLVKFDPNLPPFHRILEITDINKNRIIPDRMYKVAFNSYIAEGGDGFSWLKDVKPRYDTAITVRDVVIKKIKKEKGIHKMPILGMNNVTLKRK